MSDAEFAEFVGDCRAELEGKQALISGGPPGTPYSFDLERASFQLGDRQLRATPIGSYCPSRSTWLWAWANDSFPAPARARAEIFKGLFAITGFRVFLDEGTYADAEDAVDLTAMAVHQSAAIAFWRHQSEDCQLYLALFETDACDRP